MMKKILDALGYVLIAPMALVLAPLILPLVLLLAVAQLFDTGNSSDEM